MGKLFLTKWLSTPSSSSLLLITSAGKPELLKHIAPLSSIFPPTFWIFRMGKIGNQKRVVGLLLGSWSSKGILDIANSFAIPFDEDDKDRDVWFLDHEYLETMYSMFRKVNAKERVVGWNHTGPKLHQNDILINDLIRKYCPNSVLVIIDPKPTRIGLPTAAYKVVEEIHDDGSPTDKTFEHVPTEIGAEEAEEVGVEHLLRDVKDTTVGTLSQRITGQLMGLKGLNQKLQDMKAYLEKVVAGELPMNHEITYQMLVMYIASVIRSVIALHNLINNKLANKEAEKKEGKKEEVKELKEKKEVPEIKAK